MECKKHDNSLNFLFSRFHFDSHLLSRSSNCKLTVAVEKCEVNVTLNVIHFLHYDFSLQYVPSDEESLSLSDDSLS